MHLTEQSRSCTCVASAGAVARVGAVGVEALSALTGRASVRQRDVLVTLVNVHLTVLTLPT